MSLTQSLPRPADSGADLLVALSPDLLCLVGRDGCFQRVNPAFERTLGWTADELLGRPLLDLVHADDRAARAAHGSLDTGVPPEGSEHRCICRDGSYRWVSWLTSALHDTGAVALVGRVSDAPVVDAAVDDASEFVREHRLRLPNGTIRHARVHAAPLRDERGPVPGTVDTAEDIAEQRQAESALRTSEERYRRLVESAREGICTLDASGRITFVNPAAARLFGSTPEELIGQETHARIRHSGADGHAGSWEDSPICASIDEGAVHRVDTALFRRDDGTLFPVEYVSTPLRERGQVVGAMVAFQDITHRKQLEAQCRQSQKMEAVGRLAGGVAHDFNNLLTVITSYVMMLLTELPAEDPLRPDLREIQAAVERAAVLTRQLLAFGRQQVLDPRVIDLHQTIAGITRMLRRLIGEDIELSITAREGPPHVRADAGQIEQVIMNLVVNARDAMPTGGHLSIESGVATLTATDVQRHPYVVPGEYVRVEVSDTGCGMDPETQSRIFDPFFTTKEAGKGTGLGLAMVYGIVKQSDGYIWVNSAPGQGSTFQIYLPRVTDEPQPDDDDDAPAAIAAAHASATVLLAEDEDALRAIMQRILRKSGYRVLAARSGAEALAMAERHEGPIHLLVTDVVMPHMSGQELVEQLGQRLGDVPVLFMSGYSMDAVTNHGVLRPGAHLLKKPFTPADLTHAVRELLRAHAGSGRTGEHCAYGGPPVALP